MSYPKVEHQVLMLRQQIGDGVRLCHLLNAFTYLVDSAFIIVDDSDGYRLTVQPGSLPGTLCPPKPPPLAPMGQPTPYKPMNNQNMIKINPQLRR